MLAGTEPTSLPQSQGPVDLKELKTAVSEIAAEAPASAVYMLPAEADEEWEALIKGDDIIVANFTATWCGPCKAAKPVFAEYATLFDGKAKFVQIDVDENEEIANDIEISALPSYYVFKAGKEIDVVRGSGAVTDNANAATAGVASEPGSGTSKFEKMLIKNTTTANAFQDMFNAD